MYPTGTNGKLDVKNEALFDVVALIIVVLTLTVLTEIVTFDDELVASLDAVITTLLPFKKFMDG